MLHLQVHPTHPQPRVIARMAELLRAGALAIFPTDTTYGLGCDLFARRTVERIYRLKDLDDDQPLSLLCADLSEIGRYAVVENAHYRLLRRHLPGKYTFVLPASKETPRAAQARSRTIGVRIPDHPVAFALIAALGHPIVTTSATLPAAEPPPAAAGRPGGGGRRGAAETAAAAPATSALRDPADIAAAFAHRIEGLLDAGPLAGEPSSVVDLTGPQPRVIRAGSGDVSWVEAS